MAKWLKRASENSVYSKLIEKEGTATDLILKVALSLYRGVDVNMEVNKDILFAFCIDTVVFYFRMREKSRAIENITAVPVGDAYMYSVIVNKEAFMRELKEFVEFYREMERNETYEFMLMDIAVSSLLHILEKEKRDEVE